MVSRYSDENLERCKLNKEVKSKLADPAFKANPAYAILRKIRDDKVEDELTKDELATLQSIIDFSKYPLLQKKYAQMIEHYQQAVKQLNEYLVGNLHLEKQECLEGDLYRHVKQIVEQTDHVYNHGKLRQVELVTKALNTTCNGLNDPGWSNMTIEFRDIFSEFNNGKETASLRRVVGTMLIIFGIILLAPAIAMTLAAFSAPPISLTLLPIAGALYAGALGTIGLGIWALKSSYDNKLEKQQNQNVVTACSLFKNRITNASPDEKKAMAEAHLMKVQAKQAQLRQQHAEEDAREQQQVYSGCMR